MCFVDDQKNLSGTIHRTAGHRSAVFLSRSATKVGRRNLRCLPQCQLQRRHSAQPPGRKLHRHPSPANLDPPLESRLSSHISASLSVATRWWPSVKLARCRRLATETFMWAICARSACSQTRSRTLRPIKILYEAVLGAIWASPATKCDIAGSICAILLRRCHIIY